MEGSTWCHRCLRHLVGGPHTHVTSQPACDSNRPPPPCDNDSIDSYSIHGSHHKHRRRKDGSGWLAKATLAVIAAWLLFPDSATAGITGLDTLIPQSAKKVPSKSSFISLLTDGVGSGISETTGGAIDKMMADSPFKFDHQGDLSPG